MSDACFHTEDVACPNCVLHREPDLSAIQLAPEEFTAMITGDLSPSEYADYRTIARQKPARFAGCVRWRMVTVSKLRAGVFTLSVRPTMPERG